MDVVDVLSLTVVRGPLDLSRGPENCLREKALCAVSTPLVTAIRQFLTQSGGPSATGNTRYVTSLCLTVPRWKLCIVPCSVVRLRANLRSSRVLLL